MADSSDAELGNSYNAASAETRAANPDAEEARPAAVGKLLREAICTENVES